MNEVIRAAAVIARRDFTALVRSKAFLFFLLAPVIMLAVALAAGSVGAHMASTPDIPVIAVAMERGDTDALLATGRRLEQLVGGIPAFERAAPAAPPQTLLRQGHYAAILSGSLARPRLDTDRDGADIWPARMKLLVDQARRPDAAAGVPLDVRMLAGPPAPRKASSIDRSSTAQFGQMALFLSTMLLAGMVLSNLVEEKTNKIIEILASAIPLESIFLGKLVAMLAMALIAIGIWVGFALGVFAVAGSALPDLPEPAVGWPVFIALGVLYFSTAYLLLGSAYLGIGAIAATVRDVQTLSMPVSMGQLGIFLAATYAMGRPGSAVEIAACVFPFTSPFAMLARAAEAPQVWPHLAAILWQALWSLAIVRVGTVMFRRNVLKSRTGKRARA